MIESSKRCKPKTLLQERISPYTMMAQIRVLKMRSISFFICNWRKYKQLRGKSFNEIINIVPNFGNLDRKRKFMYIISNENKTILKNFAIFVSLMTKEHNVAMIL